MTAPGRMPFNEQLYNHIALPRDVPGHEDKNLHSLESALLTRLIDAAQALCLHTVPEHQKHIRALSDSLTACQSLNVDGAITKSAFLRELCSLQPERMLILHVSAQNCGLLIYSHYT
jgi:hypothetical protein